MTTQNNPSTHDSRDEERKSRRNMALVAIAGVGLAVAAGIGWGIGARSSDGSEDAAATIVDPAPATGGVLGASSDGGGNDADAVNPGSTNTETPVEPTNTPEPTATPDTDPARPSTRTSMAW